MWQCKIVKVESCVIYTTQRKPDKTFLCIYKDKHTLRNEFTQYISITCLRSHGHFSMSTHNTYTLFMLTTMYFLLWLNHIFNQSLKFLPVIFMILQCIILFLLENNFVVDLTSSLITWRSQALLLTNAVISQDSILNNRNPTQSNFNKKIIYWFT